MTRAGRRWLTGMAGGFALAITASLTTATTAQADDHAATQALLDQYLAKAGPRRTVPVGVYGAGLGIDEMPQSCGGVAWVKNGALPTGHTSITAATDEDHFASLATNAFATGEEAAALSVGLLGSALCE